MEKLLAFWHRNRLFIISVFGFFFLMNWCGRMIMPPVSQKQVETVAPMVEDYAQEDGVPRLKTYEELMTEKAIRSERDSGSFFLFVMLLTALLLIGYYAYKKGWLSTILPQWVRLSIRLYYDRKTGRLLLKLFLYNNTAESKTFMQPHLFFKKWGVSRSFVIKNATFLLTLTPGTGHTIVIDVEQFWDKVSDLEGFNRVGASIDTTFGKNYRTMAYPRWFVVGKI
ncbi:MAG: hypothetical protein LC643_00315 [Bacteroidales bacterium]|nr:hypothetical protein [Bacteroidales bacterium]